MYEGLICICCMATEDLVDLFSATDPSEEYTENYAEILKICFNIRVSRDEGHAHICEECSQQLKNSNNFKKQILNSISILTSVNSNQIFIEDADLNDIDTQNGGGNVSIGVEQSDNEDDMHLQLETDDDNQTDKESYFSKKRGYSKKLPYTSSPEGIKCNECGKNFSTKSLLKRHYCIHNPKHQCEHCGKSFMTSIALNNHIMLHNEEQYQCGNCNKTFSNLKLLGRHQELEHRNFDEKTVYSCEYCNKKFRYLVTKDRHVQMKHEVVLYSCPLCNYKSKRQYLKSHMANKHQIGEKKHECTYCKKKFARAIALKQHVRIHFDDRRYVCRVCNKNFIHKCSLKGHIQTHVKRGEYEGDLQDLLDHAQRTDDEYEPLEDKMVREEITVASTEESQDGMIEEFLLEDEELDEITDFLSGDGQE